MSGELLLINPRKRKTKTKARRAAPKSSGKPARRRTRRAAPVVVMTNPSPRHRRSRLAAARTRVRAVRRKYRRNPIAPGLSFNGILGMAKDAAIGAGGALAVDIAFGYVKGMLPANMQTPVATGGGLNPLYYVAKGGLAVAIGAFGRKLTKHAPALAAGSLTVQAYEVMRSMVPMSINLGYASAGRVVGAPRVNRQTGRVAMNQYVSGLPGGYRPPVNELYMGEYVS